MSIAEGPATYLAAETQGESILEHAHLRSEIQVSREG